MPSLHALSGALDSVNVPTSKALAVGISLLFAWLKLT